MSGPKLHRSPATAVAELVQASVPVVVAVRPEVSGSLRASPGGLGTVVASVAVREVLGYPMRLISELPDASSLMCSSEHGSVCFTTARATYAWARGEGIPVFTGDEMRTLAHAVENDRVGPATFARWIARKRDSGGWKLEPREAFGGEVYGTTAPQGWPVGRVLRAIGLELDAVTVGQEVPAP